MEMCDINGPTQPNTLDNDDIDIEAAKRTPPPPQLDNGNDDQHDQHDLQRRDNHTNAGRTTRAEGGDDGARARDATVSSPWYVFFSSFYELY